MARVNYLSYSSFSLLQRCPYAWKQRYLLKIRTPGNFNFALGTTFHDTIESTMLALIGVTDEEKRQELLTNMLPLFERLFPQVAAKNKVALSGDEYDRNFELGRGMIQARKVRKFVDEFEIAVNTAGKPLVETKLTFRMPGVPVPVIGYIDLVQADGVPFDLKTSGKAWGQKKADDDLQSTTYLFGMEQMGATTNPKREFGFGIFIKQVPTPVEILTVERTEAQLRDLVEMVRGLWEDHVVKGEYPRGDTDHYLCDERFCGFWSECHGISKD